MTRSWGAKPATAAPVSTMTPEASWPMMTGGTRRPVLPSMPWTSEPQIPQAITFMSTSAGPISGSGTSVNVNRLYFSKTRAFMFVPPAAALFLVLWSIDADDHEKGKEQRLITNANILSENMHASNT